MLHTRFRGNRSIGSREEDFWRVFTIQCSLGVVVFSTARSPLRRIILSPPSFCLSVHRGSAAVCGGSVAIHDSIISYLYKWREQVSKGNLFFYLFSHCRPPRIRSPRSFAEGCKILILFIVPSSPHGWESLWKNLDCTIYGLGGNLSHVFMDFHFLVLEILHTKLAWKWPSSFLEKQVLIFICKCPWAKVKKWPWPSISSLAQLVVRIYMYELQKFLKNPLFSLFPIEKPKLQNLTLP